MVKLTVVTIIITNPRILMDNRTFITALGLRGAKIVDLAKIPPMSVWKKFIGISDKPDHTMPFENRASFYDLFCGLLEARGIRPVERLFVNIGGDSSGLWIETSAESLSEVWKSGLAQEAEIECAILLPDKSSIIGITVEEGDEYWFFAREL